MERPIWSQASDPGLDFVLFLVSPRGTWDLGSRTRDRTQDSAVEAQSLNHWTSREVPGFVHKKGQMKIPQKLSGLPSSYVSGDALTSKLEPKISAQQEATPFTSQLLALGWQLGTAALPGRPALLLSHQHPTGAISPG